ncbi:MAG: acyl-CoA thioesterase [Microscillaceae bacterium]|nr:acyl-CoA thioesterase [Microscillaceae bacterium]MDW8459723.1 thioesterase family protein [Cytophagales bacterium]
MPDLSLFNFKYSLKVRWSEVDAQRVVFNGNYLNYFDVAISAYFEAIGMKYPASFLESEVDFFVRKAQILYHSPAHYNDLLDIYVRVAHIGNISLQILLEIMREHTHIASGELIYVNTHLQEKKPLPIPNHIQQMITEFERIPLTKTKS